LLATRLLKEAGQENLLGEQQAEYQKLSTAILIPRIEQSIIVQENNLQLLTGQFPGTVSRRTQLDEYVGPAELSTGLPIAMVSRRPDVRTAEMELQIANARTGIAQANMYPALNITAGGGLESFKASNWFSIPGSLFGVAAGTIVQPVFKRKELKTRFEVSKLEREQAVMRFRQSVLQATNEVANALQQSGKLKEQYAIALTQVRILKYAIGNAQLLFRSDMANYLEVITVQQNALRAELDLATIQQQQVNTMVELYRALGGGWK
jgi:outer membrane protein, multidrug efflux system